MNVQDKIKIHEILIGDAHQFVQDPDDIPGGCLTCWNAIADELGEHEV
jgi:hypothetical protein